MANRGYIREIVYTTQQELHEKAEECGSIRAGATVDPNRRADEYEAEGFSGRMYVAPTENMMKAEDKLLDHELRHNEQVNSNAAEGAGYVYVIQGRKQY